jgi:Arc/MetJ-type ribon-helix-helix transcriptional regulator
MTDAEEMVAFRLPARDRAAIQRLVDDGHFHNRSDFLRYAIKSTLREHAASPRTPDLELEGVSLPEPAPARKAAPRARKEVNL